MGSRVLGDTLWLILHWGKLRSKSRELQHLDASWPREKGWMHKGFGAPPLSGEGMGWEGCELWA